MGAPNLKEDAKRVARYAAIVGFVISIVCHVIPPEYRAVCHAVAQVCTAGGQ